MSNALTETAEKPGRTDPETAPEQARAEEAQPRSPESKDGEPSRRRRRRRRRRGSGAPAAAGAASTEVSAEAQLDGAEGEGAAEDAESSAADDEVRAERLDGAVPADREVAEEREEVPEREPVEREGSERPTAALVRDDGAPADINPDRLDVDGIKILNRLHRFGHQAYFVGGCVRDVLLGRAPKDFDICTSAHPGEVRSLFRNCRLIGRRFRLAHIYFRGGKIIEVSTFRANPAELENGDGEVPEDLLITRDNVFGTAEEDARRRDFTVNGLFYDIRLGRVIDYVDGRRDLDARLIRTIGNPEIRMREDPVRLLRAIRFAARLGFDIDPATYAAMEGAVEDLPRCAPARLLEEVFKLLRSGASRHCMELLHALGALPVLLPPIGEHLDATGSAGRDDLLGRLGALDERMKQTSIDDSLIIATLLSPLARERAGEEQPLSRAVDALLEQMVQTARLPRRIADRCRQLLWAQGVLMGERKRRRSANSFRQHPLFSDALLLAEIGAAATGQGLETIERWRTGKPLAEQPEGEKKKRRRRRPRRRRGGSGADVDAEPGGGSTPPAE